VEPLTKWLELGPSLMKHKTSRFLNLWKTYQKYVHDVILPSPREGLKNVTFWRNEIFVNILIYLTPLSLLALIPSIYMAWVKGLPIVAIVDLVAFFLVLIIISIPGLSLWVRRIIFISIIYILSIVLIAYVGMAGPSLLYLLAITVISSIIFSSSAGYYSAWANTLICIVFGTMKYFEVLGPVVLDISFDNWIAVSSNLVLLSFVCAKCLELLLRGLNSSLLENKTTEEKLHKANRLYQFFSHINKIIVHTDDQENLFRKSCQIALEIGKFKKAWIGEVDFINGEPRLLNQHRFPKEDMDLFIRSIGHKDIQQEVFRRGAYYVCNNIENEQQCKPWKLLAASKGIQSFIILPIIRETKIIGSFNLYSSETDFFDEKEIKLLEEATWDISFALDVFQKEIRHKALEDQQIISQQTIVESEAKYRAFFENSMDGILLIEANGNILSANPAACQIFLMSEEEICASGRSGLLDPSNLRARLLIQELRLSGKAKGELTFFRKDHREFPCEVSCTFFKDSLEQERISMIIRDITVRKQGEENLKQSEAKLNEAQSIAQLGNWELDFSSQTVVFSKEGGRIYGLDPSHNQLPYEEWTRFIHPGDKEKVLKKIKVSRDALSDISNPHRIILKSGAVRHIYSESRFVFDSEGHPTGLRGIVQDITERKKIEEEREKMISSIVQHNKNLEQFASIVSHNLREPVANILGLSQILMQGELEDDYTKQLLVEVAEQLDGTLKDLNNILQVKSEINEYKETVHFPDLINGIKSTIHNLGRDESARIEADFEAIDTITSIKSYIHSIFYNLISNSIKYRKADKNSIIRVKTELNAGNILISFKDDGIGIDLGKNGNKIFGLYKRFHHDVEGKGLGLFMVKTQVEALGGNVRVHSKPGEGAEFIVELPL
jgi:PAS domain S-box-containing protein